MKYIRDPGSNPNSFHLPNSFFPCLTHNVRSSQIFRDLDLVFRDKKKIDGTTKLSFPKLWRKKYNNFCISKFFLTCLSRIDQ